jgi:class 3 adenylate cyclase/tetratricopeptide (TPR) repeat protein
VQACPNCGESNPDRASFCLNCGTALPGGRPAEAERKIVTVAFCDLVGFTARSDRADPEDVKAILRPYHAMLNRMFARTGGTLDKFIGDAAVGVFGAPVTHEDDAERAVYAAILIVDELAELNREIAGADLAVRIGIATGEVFVSLGPGPQIGERITGDVLNLAAEIQHVAPVNGIAVAEPTYRATSDRFVFEPLEPLRLSGRDAELALWRPVSRRSRLVRELADTPFVGRDEEASMLRAAFRRAVSEPSVQLVTVTGEPGVGKSRLIQQFADFLDEQPQIIRWRQGRCLPYGDGVSFWPLSEIVKAEAGILETDAPEDVVAKLASSVDALVDEPSERDWLRARLAPLAGVADASQSAERGEAFTAWRRYLEAMAAEHATVLVFEDLHWADPAMLDFVQHLVDWVVGLPLLVVCAARPELYEREPGWGGGKRNSTTISLPPLSESETAMLISALLDRAILPAETQSALLERAGGNPLYAEEFVRMLTDQNLLEERGASIQLSRSASVAVPDTVQALIAARLDTLPPESKALLHDAAVVGKIFWSGALAAMSGIDEAEVRTRLRDIARKELVRPLRTSSMKDQVEYSFWHILIRDVAYAQIPRAERGAKHRAVAEWLAAVTGERVAEQAELLAYHYGQALEMARAAGAPDADELARLTATHLTAAGTRALRLDLARAESFFAHALELLPEPDRARADVLVRLGDAASAAGRFREAARHFDEATALLREHGDRVALGDALAIEARAEGRGGDATRWQRLLEEAVELLEAEPPGPELARAWSRMAGQHLSFSRYPECKEYAEKALALAERLGLGEEEVRARQFLGAARCELGDPAGLADLWAALRHGLDLGLGEEVVVTYGNLAYQLWLRDGPAIAMQVWSAAVEFSTVRGFRTQAMWSKAGQLEALFDLGRWDELLEIGHEMDVFDREGGGSQLGSFADFYQAMVLVRRGDLARATALAEEFLPKIRILKQPEYLAPALTAGAMIEYDRGHHRTAIDLVHEFVEATEGAPNYRIHFLPNALGVLLATGHLDAAEAFVPEPRYPLSVRHQHCMASVRAILAEARGEYDEGATLWADAAERWLSYGSMLERAHSLFGLGRCLMHADPAEGVARLRDARAVFAELEAVVLEREIDGIIGQATALTS